MMAVMSGWTQEQLDAIDGVDEIGIASRRPDGTMRAYVTIWAVRLGNTVYVRSAYGPEGTWYVRALESGRGSILGGGVEQDVRFTHLDADDGAHSEIDAAYRDKYRRYEEKIVATVVGPASHAVTLRVDAETLDG